MSVHYKFKSALEYDTVTFDGLHISVRDLKNAIIQQKRIGKNTDFDLQVTNAQTKEVYEDEETLIPKNTSLLIARIPIAHTNKSKSWEGYGNENTPVARTDEGGPAAKAVDLSSLDASEDDKIRAMMSQSTQDYDPSNYMKIRGANQVGVVPPNYRCYKCHQSGHWIKDCPLSQGPEPIEIKKSTGIPRSFMVPVDGPQVQGAMMTPNGSYAVPVLDHQTYTQKQLPAPPPSQEDLPDIPEDLICSICSGLLSDAVMIPCCGNSFCDECIRGSLLESEEHECPDCHERDISPGTLIPNRYLRNSVANFKNTTGYIKKPTFRNRPQVVVEDGDVIELEKKEPEVVKATEPKSDKEDSPEPVRADSAEKTIISEADSTELVKSTMKLDVTKELEVPAVKEEVPPIPDIPATTEGPPGVSPKRGRSPRRERSPKRPSTKKSSHSSSNSNGRNQRGSRDMSPRRHSRRTSPFSALSRIEERAGTPTVDEPRNSLQNNSNYGPGSYSSGGPPGVLPPMMGMPPPHMQGPPPSYSRGQPPPGVFPSRGPPPNFGLPPPGSNPPAPYMGPYNAPPRPMFDHARPPLQGPPPNYGGYPPRSRSRDYGPSRMRTRTPPGIIDDPLEAFNRMLREKDERERRAKQRKGRSYSRSSSRSYSRSPKRGRSRSPGRRRSRSRSRSFSMSRSRSFSPSPRNTPYREYSPRNVSPRRRPPSRYRSPIPVRSPPRYRYKDQGPPIERNRDRDYERHQPRERERERDNRPYSRDCDYGAGYYDRNERGDGSARWGGNMRQHPGMQQDNYYAQQQQEVHQMHHQAPPQGNRYQRDNYQSYKPDPVQHHIPPLIQSHHLPQRRYEDIAPPGTDQPPIPGEEVPATRFDDRYLYNTENNKDYKEVETKDDRPRKRSPRKSPGKSKDRHASPPDKHKKRKHDDTQEKHKKDEHKKETSDEDRLRKSKEKKKKKEKKELEKKKRREKKERHEKKKDEKKKDKEIEIEKPLPVNPPSTEPKPDLYGDFLSEGVDAKVVESYGKLEEPSKTPEMKPPPEEEPEEGEYPQESETSKDEDVLDIHANELELKSELDKEVLAPLPEKSKWEIDDELSPTIEAKFEGKQDRSGKVTNEVLKRAENAIFAKAINAIRPIEIKKISRDRAKLYSDQKDKLEMNFEDELIPPGTEIIKIDLDTPKPPPRVSVKERLGVKVDDLDRIVKVSYDRNRSRSLSPLSKRAREERIHGRDRGRYDRNPSHRREHEERKQREETRTRSKSHTGKDEVKRKRSRSPSAVKEHRHKKKDKKQKKEKTKKHKREEDEKKEEPKEVKPKPTTERRKPTLDEANFEPDYDLDTESEKEEPEKKVVVEEEVVIPKKVKIEEKKESTSSDSTDSTSEDEKKKRKHRKHKKKRSRKESTSSSSSSDSDSSEEERERKRKKHKKKQKKKKKSKHKS